MKNKLKTLNFLISDRGVNGTFWYGIRKLFYNISISKRNKFLENPKKTESSLRVGGYQFHLHPSRKGVSEVVGIYGVHEPLTTKLYLETLRPGDHVLEIGANIGYYVLLARSVVGDTGKIIGYEPVPDNVKVLKSNTSQFSNVEIFGNIISDVEGDMDFYISEIPNWGSLVNTGGTHITQKVSIPSLTLDQALSRVENFTPRIIHMDIEGGEIAAFEGAWDVIESAKPSIFVEFHPFITGFDTVLLLLQHLHKLGYESCKLIDRTVDEPWIPAWIRNTRIKDIRLQEVIEKIERGKFQANFTIMIYSPQ